MQINKLLTPYNLNRLGDTNRIRYIVIHYVGATGGAEANCRYYASKYIGASAHYYVGFGGEIWQSVEDGDIAWHCGAKSYRHPECRNSNSIGIELCVRNKGSQAADSRDWYFEDATVQAAIELTRELMEKYSIPASMRFFLGDCPLIALTAPDREIRRRFPFFGSLMYASSSRSTSSPLFGEAYEVFL